MYELTIEKDVPTVSKEILDYKIDVTKESENYFLAVVTIYLHGGLKTIEVDGVDCSGLIKNGSVELFKEGFVFNPLGSFDNDMTKAFDNYSEYDPTNFNELFGDEDVLNNRM